MQPFDIANPSLPLSMKRWEKPMEEILGLIPPMTGKAYLTIDQRELNPGELHREGGRHIDGNYYMNAWEKPSWGPPAPSESPRWGTRYPSWLTNRDRTGGIVLISDYETCKYWTGIYKGRPAEKGDCEHIDVSGMTERMMKENMLYLGNHVIHETLPVKEKVKRTLLRITLPYDADPLQ